MKKHIVVLGLILTAATGAFGQVQADDGAAFCKYTTEDALAQKDTLRAPTAQTGLSQPSVATPAQIVAGVSISLANQRKAGLTMDVARQTCRLYDATVDAQRHITYALPLIEKDVLKNRLRLIQENTDFLDKLIAEDQKLVAARNLTITSVYVLENAKLRLDTERTNALTGLVSPYVPPLNDAPIWRLVEEKLEQEHDTQAAAIKLEKQNTWDLSVSGGIQRQVFQGSASSLTTNNTGTSAYGGFTLSYNLGRRASNRHLDAAASAYDEFKKTQFNDVSQQAQILKNQITETIKIQEEQLVVLKAHQTEINERLASLEGLDTNAAASFRNELLSSRAVLNVDLGDVAYRISRLKDFLAVNFYTPENYQSGIRLKPVPAVKIGVVKSLLDK